MRARAGLCLASGVAGVLAAGAARGQCTWTNPATTGPETRNGPRLAYDSVRQRTVMFGGTVGNLFTSSRPNTTWEWDGVTWTLTTASGLGGRAYPALAFDSVRNVTVLCSGNDTFAGNLNDTWTYNGTWTQVTPAHAPSIRNAAAMCFDSGRGVAVLFGGLNSPTRLNDLWEWNGTDWTQRSPGGGAGDPPARHFAGFDYDAARAVCVLFGGNGATGNLGDTWEWNGAAGAWTQRVVAGPTPRSQMGMAYDTARHVSVLFGGPSGTATNETWEWDGTAWSPITPVASPNARYNVGMAYDAARAQTVFYGGQLSGSSTVAGDTWAYSCATPPPPCYANCDGSTQSPVLNVADFTCFLQRYAGQDPYANCDASTSPPQLNVADFTCFLQKYASGCR
jgi:hypothetical protein